MPDLSGRSWPFPNFGSGEPPDPADCRHAIRLAADRRNSPAHGLSLRRPKRRLASPAVTKVSRQPTSVAAVTSRERENLLQVLAGGRCWADDGATDRGEDNDRPTQYRSPVMGAALRPRRPPPVRPLRHVRPDLHPPVGAPAGQGLPLNPFGYLFDEITASSLIAVDPEGHAIEKRDHSKINNAASPSIRRCTWRATMRSASCTATLRPAWPWRRRNRAC